jgi:hypothetical protein
LLPVIVTNTPLYVARFKPTEVSLKTGHFLKPPREIARVPWIRFQKAFHADGPEPSERTVFIVQAERFRQFLLKIQAPGGPWLRAQE